MIEKGRVPVKCIKPIQEWSRDLEAEIEAKHSAIITIKATETDRAEFEAAANAKKNTITYSITAEIGLGKKPEKPDMPFEEITRKPRRLEPQYNPIELVVKAG